ncbi:MAG: tyrosine-type recombinase/integrase, partial [Synergistaceae bacterium]|nr:tyrosine-type recombinase/integrase [Synergistaceae bacterium]
MRRVRLTQTMIQKAVPKSARYTFYDETPGLMLRVEPSGNKIYYIDFKKNGKRSSKKLGSAEILTVAQAREAAKSFLARVALGEDVVKKRTGPALGEYLEEHYFPWVQANRKTGAATAGMIKRSFGHLWNAQVKDISIVEIEKWRVEAIKTHKAASINRELTAFRAALNWGFKRGLYDAHPLARLERLQERDSQPKVRFLAPDERERLMAALEGSEEYLRKMVVISLNTGIRRGALFSLLWSDVDLDKRILTLRGEDAKNGRINYVPLNDTAYNAFKEWRSASKGELVFPSPKTGKRMTDCQRVWASLMRASDIKNFRWHDMRHDVAT